MKIADGDGVRAVQSYPALRAGTMAESVEPPVAP